jgi:HK97 family phage major capsid protein
MPAPDYAQIEASQKQTQADLKAVGDQIKTYAERTEKEIKASGEMQAETRGKVDELLLKQGELQARVQEAEQKLVNAGKLHEPEVQQSAGHLVAAKMAEEGVTSSFRGSRRVEVPRAAITTATGGALVAPDRVGVIIAPQRRLTIRDLVAPGTTGSNAVEYVRETGFTNNAAIVGEGLAKPYSDLTFALDNANVRTIAHLFKGSRQILDDAAALQSYIDARARYGLLLAEEAQLLYGNGTGNNLKGIIPQAQTYAAPAGITVAAEQRIDRIRLALLQATLAEFPSTGVVLNPIDWAAIELLKDGEGRYITVGRRRVTSSTSWSCA